VTAPAAPLDAHIDAASAANEEWSERRCGDGLSSASRVDIFIFLVVAQVFAAASGRFPAAAATATAATVSAYPTREGWIGEHTLLRTPLHSGGAVELLLRPEHHERV
jgi:hypothetical protein